MAVLLLTLAGCGAQAGSASIAAPTALPAVVAGRALLPGCGVEHATTQHGPWNEAGRQCFWQAYLDGRRAEFTSTRLTTEGDPITSMYRVLGRGYVEVFMDTSRDRYDADRSWVILTCSTLGRIDSAEPGPSIDFAPDESCTETVIP